MKERERRWRLALGDPPGEGQGNPLGPDDQRMSRALDQLYSSSGGMGRSAPKVARWLGEVRELFPTHVVQIIQRDAIDRHGLTQLLLEPELLSEVEPDVSLVADLLSLQSAVPDSSKELARKVVQKVVDDLMKRLAAQTRDAVRGAIRRSHRTRRPREADIDWHRTIQANLRHYLPEERAIVPQTLHGFARGQRHIDHVMLVVDQSGSMAPSVIYASVFAAVMASLPAVATQLVCFDTAVVDLTEQLEDPVDVLFGIQLGGGTDICGALTYAHQQLRYPAKTHLVLISDLYEGGDAVGMLAKAREMIAAGVNIIVLLALADEGKPIYDPNHAAEFAAMGCPVFACTPDRFPALMATALGRGDVHAWAASEDIALIRPSTG